MAQNISVGTLVVGIKTQLAEFKKGMQDASKGINKLSTGITNNAASIRKAGIAITAVGAAITAAMALAVKSAANFGDEMNKMSLRTGETAEMLSALSFTAQIAGTNIATIEKAIKRAAANMFDASKGIGEAKDAFEELDIKVTNADGSLKSASQILVDFAESTKDMTDASKKAALAQDIFGRAGTQLLPFFALGKKGIEELNEQAEKYGGTLTTLEAQQGADFVDAMTRMKTAIKGVSLEISQTLVPVLVPLIEKIALFISKIVTWIKNNKDLVFTIAKVVAALGLFLTVIGTLLLGTLAIPALVAAIWAINTAFLALGITLAPVVGPVALGLAAVAAGIALIVTYRDDLKTIVGFLKEMAGFKPPPAFKFGGGTARGGRGAKGFFGKPPPLPPTPPPTPPPPLLPDEVVVEETFDNIIFKIKALGFRLRTANIGAQIAKALSEELETITSISPPGTLERLRMSFAAGFKRIREDAVQSLEWVSFKFNKDVMVGGWREAFSNLLRNASDVGVDLAAALVDQIETKLIVGFADILTSAVWKAIVAGVKWALDYKRVWTFVKAFGSLFGPSFKFIWKAIVASVKWALDFKQTWKFIQAFGSLFGDSFGFIWKAIVASVKWSLDFKQTWKFIKAFGSLFGDGFGAIWEQIVQSVKFALDFKQTWKYVEAFGSLFGDGFGAIWKTIVASVKFALDFKQVWVYIKAFGSLFGIGEGGKFGAIWKQIVASVKWALDVTQVGKIIEAFGDLFGKDSGTIWEKIKGSVDKALEWTNIGTTITKFIGFFDGVKQAIITAITEAFLDSKVLSGVGAFLSGFAGGLVASFLASGRGGGPGTGDKTGDVLKAQAAIIEWSEGIAKQYNLPVKSFLTPEGIDFWTGFLAQEIADRSSFEKAWERTLLDLNALVQIMGIKKGAARNTPGDALRKIVLERFGTSGEQGFQFGGLVPGKIGQRRLIMAHGGERVLSRSETMRRDSGGDTIINVNVRDNIVSDEFSMDKLTRKIITSMTRDLNFRQKFSTI